MRGPAFQSDGLILCAARRFPAAAGIASLAVLDNLGSPLERAAFADTSHILAIPFQTEFEILVGVESLRINGELCHKLSSFPQVSICPAICCSFMTTNSAGLSGAKP